MATQQGNHHQATHDYILSQLGQHANRDDILLEVCQRLGVDWAEAVDMVRAVEREYGREVARRQGPLLILLGGGALLAGLTLSGIALYFFVFQANFEGREALLALENSYVMGAALVTGIGMTAGSVYGLARVIANMVDD